VRDKLQQIDFAALAAEEDARLDALDTESATLALVAAILRLAEQEARRLDVPCLDPTYHGCNPVWRDALNATADVVHVVLGIEQWDVPLGVVLGMPSPHPPEGGH
jgi:hypothetical protein